MWRATQCDKRFTTKSNFSYHLCIHSGGRHFKLCKCETLSVFFVMSLLMKILIVSFLNLKCVFTSCYTSNMGPV